MENKRRKFSAEYKTRVVLEALTERLSLSELSQKYQVHPNLLNKWKKEFISKASNVFEVKNGTSSQNGNEDDSKRLYEKIGQLQVENDFLKKVSTILNR